MDTNGEKASRFGLMLVKARTDAGKSRKYMAQALDKSLNTIQNWEDGLGNPSYKTVEKWFNVLGLNMEKYILEYKYPDIYNGLTPKSDIDNLRYAIHDYIDKMCSDRDIRQMAYCMFGKSGSPWHAQMNMLTANNHCTMRSRVNVAQIIIDNFKVEEARGELINTEHVMPDMDALALAADAGRIASYNGANGYTITMESRNELPNNYPVYKKPKKKK